MGLAIVQLEEKDISKFVQIELEAFRTHPRIRMLWRRGYTDDLYAFYESDKRQSLTSDPDCRMIKAVDEETGEIVAAAEWYFKLDPSKHSPDEATESNAAPPPNWPVDGNWELRSFFNQNLTKWKKQYVEGKPYIKLDILVTNPDFQRRGAGSALLAWGINHADRNGALMCLEATPAGLALYKQHGFQEMEVIKADMKAFGWNEPYDEDALKRVWMIRHPQT